MKNNLKTNYIKSRTHTKEDNLHFYKNTTNQTLTFISSKRVYFKSVLNIEYSTHRKQTALPLNVPYHHQSTKLAVGAMTEPLLT